MFAVLRQRNFALLWFASLISLMGDWMLLIGLPIYIFLLTHSALATSIMFMAGIVPKIVLSSLAGVFVDRWNRKYTMVVCNILLALGLLPLLFFHTNGDLWVIYVVSLLESVLSVFFIPAEEAMIPSLVHESELVTANALGSLNQNIARLVGPSIGGIVAGVLGLNGFVLLDTASYLIAGIMIALIVVDLPATESRVIAGKLANAWRSFWQEWQEGLQLVAQGRQVFSIFSLMAITSLGEGVFSVLFIVFVSQILHGGALELSWLMVAQAVGGVIGGLLIGYVSKRLHLSQLIGYSAIAFGIFDLLIFNYPRFVGGLLPGLFLFVLAGVVGVGIFTGANTLLQNSVSDQYRGRIFGTMGMTSAILMLLGTALAGFLGNPSNVIAFLNIQGSMYILAGVFVLFILRANGERGRQEARRKKSVSSQIEFGEEHAQKRELSLLRGESR